MASENESYRDFEHLARNFCDCLEESSLVRGVYLRAILEALAPLYSAATHFAEIQATRFDEKLIDDDGLPTEQRQRLLERLKNALPFDSYWVAEKPFQADPGSTICGSLTDDLHDIWLDLKPGLVALQTLPVENRPDVYWHWKFTFEIHWGTHAVDALWAIHNYLRDT